MYHYKKKLTAREIVVLSMRLGVYDHGHVRTLSDVAQYYQVSRSWISKIYQGGLHKLKNLTHPQKIMLLTELLKEINYD